MAVTKRLLLPVFCLLYKFVLATYDDAVRQLMKSSFLSDVVIHFTSGQLHRLVMELSEERAELQEMRDMLQDNFDKIEDKLNALLLADLKAALLQLKSALFSTEED